MHTAHTLARGQAMDVMGVRALVMICDLCADLSHDVSKIIDSLPAGLRDLSSDLIWSVMI